MVRSYQRQESHLAKLAKSHGRDYGKPKPGSESEKRSIAYQVDSEATVLMSISFSYTFLLLLKSEHCFIVQKEVIKECVHMCQMVAQFGTRWTCVFVFLYLYIWICVFVFAFFVLCIVQTSIKFNLWLNFHLRLADGTEQIQFGDLFRLTESLTNKCVGILQRARKHRLPFTLFTFYLEADLWSTTEKNHPFWQRGDLTLTCELCRLIHFAGDTLWQGEDDQKLVTLIRRNREVQVWLFKTIQEFYQGVQVKSSTLRFFSQNRSRMISIQVYFEHTRQLLPNNPGSNTVFGELSYHWSLSLPRFKSIYHWSLGLQRLKSIVVLSFWLFKKQQLFCCFVSYCPLSFSPSLSLPRSCIISLSIFRGWKPSSSSLSLGEPGHGGWSGYNCLSCWGFFINIQ